MVCKEHLWVAPVRHIMVAIGSVNGVGSAQNGQQPIAAWATPTNRMPVENPHALKEDQRHVSNEPSGDGVFCVDCRLPYYAYLRSTRKEENRPFLREYLARGEAGL